MLIRQKKAWERLTAGGLFMMRSLMRSKGGPHSFRYTSLCMYIVSFIVGYFYFFFFTHRPRRIMNFFSFMRHLQVRANEIRRIQARNLFYYYVYVLHNVKFARKDEFSKISITFVGML